MNKIISYIGFAIKSGNIVIGQGKVKHCTKKLHLIMVCSSATENLKDLAQNTAKKHGCPVIITKPPLQELTNQVGVKIIGITDGNLSKAIITNKESINIG